MTTDQALPRGTTAAPRRNRVGDGDDLMLAAQAAHRNGNPEQAAALYGMALECVQDSQARYVALLGLASAQCDSGRLDLAEKTCRRAVDELPSIPAGYAMLASVLLDEGRLGEAAVAAQVALRRAPSDARLLNLACGVALRRGRAGEARAHAERCLALHGGDQRALAQLAIALAQTGCDNEASRLLDFDKLLKVSMVAAPRGFASIDAFNRVLVDTLVKRPDLSYRHTARTLVGGARLNDSFVIDPALAVPLRQIFTDALDRYVAELRVARDHPFLAGRPARVAVSSWANIMEEAAFELPHMHEGTWLSGVYYPEVALPPGAGDDGGAIEFGGHDFGEALPHPGPTRRVMPRPGMLVMFPSFFYHRTIPFTGHGRRISIAYDAGPAR